MSTEPPFILFAIVIIHAWSRCLPMRLAFPSGNSGLTAIPWSTREIEVYHHAGNISSCVLNSGLIT